MSLSTISSTPLQSDSPALTPSPHDDASSSPTQLLQNPPTFELFPKLPAELRDRVWRLALPGPRVIRPRARNLYHPGTSIVARTLYWSDAPIPAVLHTCPESRALGLKFYERLGLDKRSRGCGIYVDYSIDIVFFDGKPDSQMRYCKQPLKDMCIVSFLRDLPVDEIEKICHVAIEHNLWYVRDKGGLCSLLYVFSGMRSLIVARSRDEVWVSKSIAFVEPQRCDITDERDKHAQSMNVQDYRLVRYVRRWPRDLVAVIEYLYQKALRPGSVMPEVKAMACVCLEEN